VADFLEGRAARVRSLPADEAAVARRAFRLLLEGRAVPPAALVSRARARETVAGALARLRDRGMLALDPATGDVVHARGLSLLRTAHAMRLDDRPLYANCAVDAVGIPAALSRDAAVASRCHACRAPLTLALRAGAVALAPAGLAVWAPDFDPSRPLDRHT
jgi:hypothetical protein